MLKAITKKTRTGRRTKIRARRTKPVEAVMLTARVCETYIERCPGLTLERLMSAVREVVEEGAKGKKGTDEKGDGEKKSGLHVICYKPEDECEHFDCEDGWCNRFNCPCAEIHDKGEAEDE